MTMRKKNAKPDRKVLLAIGGGSLLLVLIALIIIMVVRGSTNFVPHTKTARFERDIIADSGLQVRDPASIVAVDGATHLGDICSTEQLRQYGGYHGGDGLVGVGAQVDLVVMSGKKQIGVFPIKPLPAWQKSEETPNPSRTSEAKHWCAAFGQQANLFASALPVKRISAIVVDVTDPVSPALADRIREQARQVCDNGGEVYLYALSDTAYQGGRKHYSCSATDTASLDELLRSKGDPRSSIYDGLHEVFGDLATFVHQDPYTLVTVQLFTDGVQNTPAQDFYHHPELLNPENWGALDESLSTKDLQLTGMRVVIHPTPDEAHPGLVKRAIAYLSDRFRAKGGVVQAETF